ncbi:ArsR/SmtB family transcription factor [Longispora albida]|uniref:ArsR/SmtB family transcription factor n=1 Tax=Longispora albida TaxID=203523 RepID=UPI0003687F27|nr:DUF5937 family protein [Longispora albida]
MAVTLRFGPADLLRTRFAVSPAFETIAAIRLTAPGESPGHHERWLHAARQRLGGLDLRPVTVLQPRRGYSPDFLAPPPGGPATTIGEDLARIAATPPEQARAEISRALAGTPGASDSELGRSLLGDPAAVLTQLTGLIRNAWHAMVEPVWPRVRALLDADISHQSRRLAEGGLGRLLTELHPTLSWHDGVLTRSRGDDEHRDLRGEGVVLMPSCFKWDQVLVVLDEPWQPTVIYPARGIGALWEPVAGTADAALAKLLGTTRANILSGLTEPASTTAIAYRYALAPATVSQHLTVLRDAGMVAGARHRYEIRYRRTELGDAVVAARAATLTP